MDDPILTIEEREAINSGRWFSSLSPSLRHDILRCAYANRFKDGEPYSAHRSTPHPRRDKAKKRPRAAGRRPAGGRGGGGCFARGRRGGPAVLEAFDVCTSEDVV